jgi:hypothetical protein
MFQSKDLPLLMSLPTQDGSLFLGKLTESLACGARSMILPFPICISFLSVFIREAGSPFASALFLLGWIGVMLQLISLSVIVALALGRLIIATRWGILLRIIAVIASLAFLVVFFAGYVYQPDTGVSLAKLSGLSAFLPTSWLVAALPHEGFVMRSSLLYGAGFVALTAICPAVAFYLFKRRFREIWAMTMEVKQRKGRRRATPRGARRTAGTMGNTRAIILKEALVMRREPHTWIGLVILLMLFPVFILLRSDSPGTQATFVIVISLLATASYSLSCIGREGHSFALLRSLPMRMSELLRAKFVLGCAINFALTLAFVSALYLTKMSSPQQTWQNVLTGAVASIYLSASGTALAAIFPKFDFTSPMRAASMPGILLLYLIALLFGGSLVGVTSLGWHYAPLVLVPWAGVVMMLTKVGQSRLEKMDI